MSLCVKNYKEVSRVYFNRILYSKELDIPIDSYFDSIEIEVIKSLLRENRFEPEYSHVIWWRIHYNQYNRIIRIEPIFDK